MSCFRVLGERSTSHGFEMQLAGLQISTAIRNRFTTLGTPLAQREGEVCPGKGDMRPSENLRYKTLWVHASTPIYCVE
jgi:hypothetical protein